MTTSNDVLIAANRLTEALQLALQDGRFAEFVHLGGLALRLFTARQNFARAFPEDREGNGFDAIVEALAAATALLGDLEPQEAAVAAFARRVVSATRLLAAAVTVRPAAATRPA